MRTVTAAIATGLILILVLAACGPRTGGKSGRSDSAEIAEPEDTSVTSEVAAGPWESARLRGADFRAIGQEPGWTLAIYEGDSLVLAADYGQRRITTPAPEAVMRDDRTTYHAESDAHTLSVTIERTACSDIMSGEQFEATTSVVLDADTLRGCGRSL